MAGSYEDMKAQFLESDPEQGRPGKQKSRSSATPTCHPRKTPLDSMIRMFPYAIIFFIALGIGSWYMSDPEAAQDQMKQWAGMTVKNPAAEVQAQELDTDSTGNQPSPNALPIDRKPSSN